MPTKYYDLKPGDKAAHGDGELLTFRKMDGMYATWTNDKGEMCIGSCEEYEMRDGIYYPVAK